MNIAFKLWFDDAFLVKRLKEQEIYLIELQQRLWLGEINYTRYEELRDCAAYIKASIEHQLKRPHPNNFDYTK